MPERLKRVSRVVGPLAALAVVWLLFAVLVEDGKFVALGNLRLMLLQTAVVGTAAVGATLIIASKGLDLSVGSTVALGTMMIALLLNEGWPAWAAAIVGGMGTAVVVGGVIGLLVSGKLMPKLELSPFIVTLGMMGVVRGIAHGVGDERPLYPSGGSGFLPYVMASAPMPSWAPKLLTWAPPGVWIFGLTAVGMGVLVSRTLLGRRALAIGDNEVAARYAGVPVAWTKVAVYMIGVGCAGVASVLQFSVLTGGDPTTANGMELSVIAAVVIGGTSLSGGSVARGIGVGGTIVGALLMTVVSNGCTKLELQNWVQTSITGLIIVGAVALDQWRRR